MSTEIIQNETSETISNPTIDQKTQKKVLKNFQHLPKDIHISTMTITCLFETNFNVKNIGEYMSLATEDYGIQKIVYGKTDDNVRTKIKSKKKVRKGKQIKKNFFNQTTLVVKSKNLKNDVNVKIFQNGSIHMTGCKGDNNFYDIMSILCTELSKIKGVYNPTTDKILPITFAEDPEIIKMDNIQNVKIRMINTNFSIGFKIDRDKLYKSILTSKTDEDVSCTFEPCAHAGVNIKYNYKNKSIVSIFVFESGSIIITGAKKANHIIKAYEYITKHIYENYNLVILNQISLESLIEKVKEKREKQSPQKVAGPLSGDSVPSQVIADERVQIQA